MLALDYYELLGVPRSADAAQITRAFRERAMALHPDRNRENPEAAAERKAVTEAYQTLIDPAHKARYDESIGAGGALDKIDSLAQLWQVTQDLYVKRSPRYSKAMDAMRIAVPLVIEDGGLLVLGVDARDARLVGYLDTSDERNRVRAILSELQGTPLDFRIISGTTLAEWEAIKAAEKSLRQREAEMKPTRPSVRPASSLAGAAPSTQPADPGLTGATATSPTRHSFEDLLGGLPRAWSGTEARSYPQVRARFLLAQLEALAHLEDHARLSGTADAERQADVAKALDRIASTISMDSGVVAIEYLRVRARVLGGL
jgi:hypothetical protein